MQMQSITNINQVISYPKKLTEKYPHNIKKGQGCFNFKEGYVNYLDYSSNDLSKNRSILEFEENTLTQFNIINKKEIMIFICEHLGLIELIDKVIPIIKKYFPDYSFSLEFSPDPEIPNLNHLILYVNGDEDSFDDDWEELKNINRDIRSLELYDNSVKRLFSVDLW